MKSAKWQKTLNYAGILIKLPQIVTLMRRSAFLIKKAFIQSIKITIRVNYSNKCRQNALYTKKVHLYIFEKKIKGNNYETRQGERKRNS